MGARSRGPDRLLRRRAFALHVTRSCARCWAHCQRRCRSTFTRTVGQGKVIVFSDSILNPAEAALRAARQKAYGQIAALVGADYAVPQSVPETAPGYGTMALATLGGSATALTSFDDFRAGSWPVRGAGQIRAACPGPRRTRPRRKGRPSTAHWPPRWKSRPARRSRSRSFWPGTIRTSTTAAARSSATITRRPGPMPRP